MTREDTVFQKELEEKPESCADVASGATGSGGDASAAALGALLEASGEREPDAERWARLLAERLARLDALNVGGMLAAATEGGGAGARLADRLEAGGRAGDALGERRRRYEALARTAAGARTARSAASRVDDNRRALLAELGATFRALDAPPLRDLDSLAEAQLATPEGRARALEAGRALRAALREGEAGGPRARLAAVRDRLRRLARARDALAANVARHLNNALVHLGNEAAAEGERARPSAHHAPLLPFAPHLRWLRETDARAHEALVRVYAATWARVYERETRAAMEAARASIATTPPRLEAALDRALTFVEGACDVEQDFVVRFFGLDLDADAELQDQEQDQEQAGQQPRGLGPETRRLMADLFPSLERDLVALVAHVERVDAFGAMRALACCGRRVLGGEGGEGAGGEGRWVGGALAGAAVAAKRGADRALAERLAALPAAAKLAARRPKCGVLGFVRDLEALGAACEGIFAGGRRADLDRWYLALAAGMMEAIERAEHPRTPRAVVQLENYHALRAAVSALRVPALEAVRRECGARYNAALRRYVTRHFAARGPLERLAAFFEGVAEAVAAGAREDEVCYRAAFGKHELRRLLALHPREEVVASLRRLYRTVEKHVSAESGLLQVVWRAMQEEFIAQHAALQARLQACYAGSGLAMPLSTQDILDAFSDIARDH